MTPEEYAAKIDLGCTEMDDHDPPPCHKCENIRAQIANAIRNSNAPSRVVEAEVVAADVNMIRRLDVRQRAAEIKRGRMPKVGDRVQRRRDPIEVVAEVNDYWVRFEREGCGAARDYLADSYDYLDEAT